MLRRIASTYRHAYAGCLHMAKKQARWEGGNGADKLSRPG